MSFTKRALKKVTTLNKVKKFITQARSQGRFLLVQPTAKRRRVGREPGKEFFLFKC